jgi:prevent-host-death family protein
MGSVGVRELRDNATDILRRVRERGESFEVTFRGRPVALLVPAAQRLRGKGKEEREWEEIDRLAAEIGARWRGCGAEGAVAEQRR